MDTERMAALLMGTLSLVCVACVLYGLKLSLERTIFGKKEKQKIFDRSFAAIMFWIVGVGILARLGFFADFSLLPPRPVIAIFLPLPFMIWIAFSKKGTDLLKTVPPHWLIGMQVFRIGVELLLWRAAVTGLLPVQMSFEGYNFDIFSGLLAIPVALSIRRKQRPALVLLYNIAGLLLLLNILVVALLSMPTPLRYFMNEPSAAIVGSFPFIYLPSVLVVMAYGLHIFSLRQYTLLGHRS